MKNDRNSTPARAWAPVLLIALLGLAAVAAGLALLRTRYGWGDLFDLLWHVGVRLSRWRVAVGVVVLGLAVWLLARRWNGASAAYPALAAYGLGVLADALVLSLLEPLGVSFGPLLLPLTLLAGVRCAVALTLGLLSSLLRRARPSARAWSLVHVGAQALILALFIDGMVIEPARLTVSHVRLSDPHAVESADRRPLRIVQVSDLHIERANPLMRHLVEQVNALDPDLIVVTGDLLNTSYTADPQARTDLADVLGALRAREGVYVVRGNVDELAATTRVLRGLPVTLLEDEWETLEIAGRWVALCGVPMEDYTRDGAALEELVHDWPEDHFTVLLYHAPNLAPEAAAAGFDLMPTGHTHGGQIRLPIYGALTTFSIYGKRYEMGPYRVGDTLIYVSRGVGMEGWIMPRMRFLCPPEIVVYDVT